jgi:hypothetical protein
MPRPLSTGERHASAAWPAVLAVKRVVTVCRPGRLYALVSADSGLLAVIFEAFGERRALFRRESGKQIVQ